MTTKEESIATTQERAYRAHPWHGVSVGPDAPDVINCYIEIVTTDTIKYELDKESGILKVDRPQQYSSHCPALYGLVPRTYCADRVGNFCAKKSSMTRIKGDEDPLDIMVLAEKAIVRGDILLRARPIGGLRVIDDGCADDKIIAVMEGDDVYRPYRDISDCPEHLIDRLWHYFLTYKDHPGKPNPRKIQIVDVYGRDDAHEVIKLSMQDYDEHIGSK